MLRGWDNFYIMAGTSGATFIGLLFVVISLSSGWRGSPGKLGADGFLTPTLMHFCGVLFLALAILVPWPSAWPIGVLLGLVGVMGLAYQIRTILIKRQQAFVALHWHDWIPHAGLPALGNASLLAGAAGLILARPFAPYAIAAAVTLLLIAGIYGAWDITLWIVRNRDSR
jgi:hypothetical protein